MASPLFPIITSIACYFLSVLPFMAIDMWGKHLSIQKYKIQPEKEVTWSMVREGITITIWNQIIWIMPVTIAQWLWTPDTVLPDHAPPLFELIGHTLAALAVFDFEYWVWHSVHHKIRPLYRWVHSIHHLHSSPCSWTTQLLHPWELISVGIFTYTSPLIFRAHPLTCWWFNFFSIWVSVDAHIGYDFPFLPHHWAPFGLWGGSIKHDMHHQRPLTNFEPFFTIWDRLCGWECPGQLAGGIKSKALVEYDRFKAEAIRKKHQ